MSGTIVYDRTIQLATSGVDNWWDYFTKPYTLTDNAIFDDLPDVAGSTVKIEVTAASAESEAAVGRVVFGNIKDAGVTLTDVQLRLLSFSSKKRDDFGNLNLLKKRSVRIMDYDLLIGHARVEAIRKMFQQLDAVPTLYMGHEEMPETYTFGVYDNFSVIINGHTDTECSLSIEEF